MLGGHVALASKVRHSSHSLLQVLRGPAARACCECLHMTIDFALELNYVADLSLSVGDMLVSP